ncbi:hypothetical protein ACIBTV_26795 [Micromonospora sp. NPDC049366]|uniref:hypothetical protein n=1 Tax=Micromonospora sp. NPDC049366 TaxID=3364271 RepID=UPI00378F0099
MRIPGRGWWRRRPTARRQSEELDREEFRRGRVRPPRPLPAWAQRTRPLPTVEPLMTLGQRCLYRVPGGRQ